MIIIGYQGLGKTTICQKYNNYIDLKCSDYRTIENNDDPDWFLPYCLDGEKLSHEGKVVFMSHNIEVCDYMKSSSENNYIIIPDDSLYDYWIEKLKNRSDRTGQSKDYYAWLNAKDNFYDEMKYYRETYTNVYIIYDQNYSLEDIVLELLERD